jgi:hypothetical protein
MLSKELSQRVFPVGMEDTRECLVLDSQGGSLQGNGGNGVRGQPPSRVAATACHGVAG